MRIAVPRDPTPGERRVAGTPKTVQAMIALGHEVAVERGAGAAASFPDEAYAAAGAGLVDADTAWSADLVITINPPTLEQVGRLRQGSLLASLLAPATSPELLQALAQHGVTALAMDAVPRISRAQSLDVLSSMANLAGYRAVIEAAHEFGGLFTGQVTAAGKVPPARVFVVGAGVAGLAAIGAAGSLGAEVVAFDVRPEVAEQVESMGARFIHLDLAEDTTTQRTDGYAAELAGDAETAARTMYDEQARTADIVITTALIPGRPAPELITAATVAAMRPGSVVVDLAATNGGNVADTVAGERIVTDNGVTVLGWTDLAGRLPTQASQLYGTNVLNLIKLLTVAGPDGTAAGADLRVDLDDEVLRAITVTHDAAVTWPPPPISVSAVVVPAGTAAGAASAEPHAQTSVQPSVGRDRPAHPMRRVVLVGLAAVLFALIATVSPSEFLGHFTVLALAVVAGYYVISHVTHALHTPLMSVTNAISGIILVGAVLQVGSADPVITALSLAGIVIASVNIFGGFVVTRRMLSMFRRDPELEARRR